MSRLEEARDQLPGAAKIAAQFAIDNAGPVAVTACGMFVLNQVAFRAVRPRTAVQALALGVVLFAAEPVLVEQLVRRGVLKFTIRDPHGCKHDLRKLLRESDDDRALAEA